MTRLYLICTIFTGAILLQSLASRPPEVIWKEPQGTVDNQDEAESGAENPISRSDSPKEDQLPNLIQACRQALKETAHSLPEIDSTQQLTKITSNSGVSLLAKHVEVDSGKFNVLPIDGPVIQIDAKDVQQIDSVYPEVGDGSDQTLELLGKAKAGDKLTDQEIQIWFDSGGAEDLLARFPLKGNKILRQFFIDEALEKNDVEVRPMSEIDFDELDEWTASVRDDISRGISESRRTLVILEIDQRLSQLQGASNGAKFYEMVQSIAYPQA